MRASFPEKSGAISRRRTAKSTTRTAAPAIAPRHEALGIALGLAGLAVLTWMLHHEALGLPFNADDYFFLLWRRLGLIGSLVHAFTEIGSYFRPLGREIHFWLVGLVAGPNERVFHLANFALLLATIAMTAMLGAALAGWQFGLFAAGAYALLYPHRVLIGYASCSQDLLAALLGTTCAWGYVRGRRVWPAVALFAAMLGKESVVTLPLILFVWETSRGRGRLDPAEALRRTAPLWIALAAWALAVPLPRHFIPGLGSGAGNLPIANVPFDLATFARGQKLAMLAYVGLEQPWTELPWPPPVSGLEMGAIALAALFPWLAARAAPRPADTPPVTRILVLAIAWTVLGALPVAMVGARFSAYYITFAGVGFALLVATLLAARPVALAVPIFAALAFLGVRANHATNYRPTELNHVMRPGISITNFFRLANEAQYVRLFREFLLENRPSRGATIYLSQPFGFTLMGTGGESAPRVWLDDPDVHVKFFTDSSPLKDPGPRLLVRVDVPPLRFSRLPDSLLLLTDQGGRLLDQGRFAEARRQYEAALPYCESDRLADLRSTIEVNLATVAHHQGDDDEALRLLHDAVRLTPSSRPALINLGAHAMRMGQLEEARRWLSRALAVTPGDSIALHLLAVLDGRRAR